MDRRRYRLRQGPLEWFRQRPWDGLNFEIHPTGAPFRSTRASDLKARSSDLGRSSRRRRETLEATRSQGTVRIVTSLTASTSLEADRYNTCIKWLP
jgi:hypothetical protein